MRQVGRWTLAYTHRQCSPSPGQEKSLVPLSPTWFVEACTPLKEENWRHGQDVPFGSGYETRLQLHLEEAGPGFYCMWGHAS